MRLRFFLISFLASVIHSYPLNLAEDELYNHAVIIDCGSSGSRMFVYHWKKEDSDANVIPKITIKEDSRGNQIVSKQTPGLSEFPNKLNSLPDYLGPLLNNASANIPQVQHKDTPLFILATAGMRFLTEEEQNSIWDRVRFFVKSNYNFNFHENNAKTIDGAEEGIFGWISINYLLGRLDEGQKTVGMIDLGGGSMQIAFQVRDKEAIKKPTQAIKTLNLGPNEEDLEEYSLYVTTFLGYGVNAARRIYKGILIDEWMRSSKFPKDTLVTDPCLPLNATESVNAKDLEEYDDFFQKQIGSQLDSNKLNLIELRGNGDVTSCAHHLQPLLAKNKPCNLDPCSMNGIFQPRLPWKNVDFYGLSEFWFTSMDIAANSKSDVYSREAFMKKAQDYCQSDWPARENNLVAKLKGEKPDKVQELLTQKRIRCFNAAWITSFLHDGFGFPDNFQRLHVVNDLNNIEVQWSLGALIYKLREHMRLHRGIGIPFRWINFIYIGLSLILLSTMAFYCCKLIKRARFSSRLDFINCLRPWCPDSFNTWLSGVCVRKRRLSRQTFPSFSRLRGRTGTDQDAEDEIPLYTAAMAGVPTTGIKDGLTFTLQSASMRSASLPNFFMKNF